MKTYNIFISHSWNYYKEYANLVKLIQEVWYFRWKNYSVSPEYCFSRDKFISKRVLQECLDRQIKPVNCVIIIGGKYINYAEWIQREIEISNFYEKPMIGIIRRGIRQIPEMLKNVCMDIIGWNISSIVNSIKRHIK